MWPLLLARVDLEAELVLRMEEQHERVAAGSTRSAALLPEWERTASPAAGEAIAVAIERAPGRAASSTSPTRRTTCCRWSRST